MIDLVELPDLSINDVIRSLWDKKGVYFFVKDSVVTYIGESGSIKRGDESFRSIKDRILQHFMSGIKGITFVNNYMERNKCTYFEAYKYLISCSIKVHITHTLEEYKKDLNASKNIKTLQDNYVALYHENGLLYNK